MDMPQLRVQSTHAQIEITRTPGKQEIEQPKPTVSIEQPQADLTIEITPAKLSIDQTEAWADMDLKHVSRRIEEFAQKGYEDWLAGIGRMAQDGDQLMHIENGGDPMADQAKVNSENPIYEFNVGWIPSANSVKTSYEKAKVDIDIKANLPKIDIKANLPIINYTPGNVEVKLKNYHDIKFDFSNLKHVGIKYEQNI
ncbi:DUF6470 family protein [Bacillus timonensis]|nr:DUF6470 family protein [Bacillus timonensis]